MVKCDDSTTICNQLTIEQIAEIIKEGKLLRWHSGYHREEWCDGPAPLKPTSILKISDKSYYVGYICANKECNRCKHPISIWSEHHKLIRPDGLDLHGYGEEVQISKKKTEVVLKDQPVFSTYEEDDV